MGILKRIYYEIQYRIGVYKQFGWDYLFKSHREIKRKRGHLRTKRIYGTFNGNKKSLKISLIKKNGSFCKICKKYFPKERLTIDHITSKAHGGTNGIYNLQLLCLPCHIKKDKEVVTRKEYEPFLGGKTENKPLAGLKELYESKINRRKE